MANFDVMPFKDKNSERYMLSKRIKKYADVLEESYLVTARHRLHDFYFRDGQYKIEERDLGEWTAFDDENDLWGYPECYCWFKQSFDVPAQFKGKNLYYRVMPHDGSWREVNPQLILFSDNKCIQGLDSNHQKVKLLESSKGNEHFNIFINAHTDAFAYRGKVHMRAELQSLDDDVQKLIYHIRTPLMVANLYGADDLPRVNIIKQLNTACNLIKINLPYGVEFKKSVNEAIKYIEANVFGKGDEPVVSAIGHTHIDVAWLWRLRQTRDKAGRTFSTMLKLMEENPDFKFISSQAQLYDYVKKDYPEVYERIKQKVREGKWEVEGGMWVEADTNVSSGESLIRQFLVGKRFFRKEFDKDCKILWLPDVFGYSGALPQIMKRCGIKYFMTTKISWNEYTKIPYDTFKWKGIDGTEILSHFIPAQSLGDEERGDFMTTYNGMLEPKQVMGGWKRYQNKDLNKNILFSYGYGDGGGGTTQEMYEHGLRMRAGIEGCPQVKYEFASDFFRRLDKEVSADKSLNTWFGELYLEFHRATLTAQARNKRFNRKSEVMYQDIENVNVLSAVLVDNSFDRYPKTGIDNGWETILLNQFHDIIPGSSINAVYEDSKIQYENIANEGRYMLHGALDRIAASIKAENRILVVFNTLGFTRNDVVICDSPASFDFSITDDNGIIIPHQRTYDGKIAFFAQAIPSKGYKTYYITPLAENSKKTTCTISGNKVSSRFFDIEFNESMEMVNLIHKKSGRAVAPKGVALNKLVAYEDRPFNHEAWNTNAYYTQKSWGITNVSSAKAVENGPVRTVLNIKRSFQSSHFDQYIIIYNDIDRIDVINEVDWREDCILVKAEFPVDVNAAKACYDIQFGNIERSAHENTAGDFAQFEVAAQKWADMSDNSFGLSVLNDCKYGYSAKNGKIGLTLLRSQNHPCKDQDKEMHYFTYSIYPHEGAVAQSDVVMHGYMLNYPLYTAVAEGGGSNKPEYSLISADKSNIIIETVKKAEDSPAIIVRLFETWNKRTFTTIDCSAPIAKAYECNMLEEDERSLISHNGLIDLEFKPFEIKTIKLILK